MRIKLDFFGPNAKFHHVGIAVRDIERNCPSCEKITDPMQHVSVALVTLNGLKVELVEPAGEKSPVDESLKKGTKFLHICYSVPNLEEALSICREHSFHRIAPISPATAFEGKRISWVYSNTYGLFELLENS